MKPVLRYAITNRNQYPGDEAARRRALLKQTERLAQANVEYLQLREKDLAHADLIALTIEMLEAIAHVGSATRLILNAPADVASAAGAHGVHCSAALCHEATRDGLIVSASCHTLEDVVLARMHADLILFAPVFEKRVQGELVTPGSGLPLLRDACREAGSVPVFALGGVTESNTKECLSAGAVGVAGIRLFA